jgi:hypothetical protein
MKKLAKLTHEQLVASVNFNLQRFNLDNFIPTLWSAELLVSLKNSLVFGQSGVVNRDYEGTISGYGDTVKINAIGEVSTGDYTKNTDMDAPQTLDGTQTTLVIDQAKYFNFQIDDIDKAQQNPKVMQQAMAESAYSLRNDADRYVADKMATAVTADNVIDKSAETFTPAMAYEQLVDLSVRLDENNVPEEGRYVIVPPFFVGLIEKDDRFTNATEGGNAITRNGFVGRIAGFNVLKSNNVNTTAGADESSKIYNIVAGHQMATSYAEQVNEVETYRPERRFADAVKGLHLYGAKVVRPTALVMLKLARPKA